MELGCTVTVSLVNPDLGDLSLDDNGLEEVLTELVDEVNQRLMVRFNFFQGEWFLNLQAGTPYYQHIFQKGVTDAVIRHIFGTVVRGTEGVATLTDLSYTRNNATRRMALTFKARLQDGTLYAPVAFNPFVVLV